MAISSEIWLTSEDNSFGIAGGKWFDGDIERYQISSNYKNHLNITQVTEYQNLETLCSSVSYYECLAERFLKIPLPKQHLDKKR